MFLSFIVPVYNAQNYLSQCLDSLINQDISDFEIICVNDGSTDNSSIILDKYSKEYNNIIIKNKTNSGVSASRNEGIRIAQGDYIWFIDADDFISPNILGKLKELATSCNPDRITVESYTFNSELETEQTKNLKPNVPYKKVFVTRTLYRREYLNLHNIMFANNVHYGEDGLFNYQTMIYNPKTIDYNILAYFYRVHNASVTFAPKEKRLKLTLEGSKQIFDILIHDYNSKICLSETRRMLLYWIGYLARYYSLLDYDYFNKNFVWDYNLTCIPFRDFELRIINKTLLRISKTRNYHKIVKLAKKNQKKEIRQKVIQKNKKIIIGYIKHPKRLLKKLINK